MTFKLFFLSGFLTLLLSSCSSLDDWLAVSTPIPLTETPAPTSTIIWFPPSATPTPQFLSTKAPTPEMRPVKWDSVNALHSDLCGIRSVVRLSNTTTDGAQSSVAKSSF